MQTITAAEDNFFVTPEREVRFLGVMSTELLFTNTPEIAFLVQLRDDREEKPFFFAVQPGDLEARIATWRGHGFRIVGIEQVDGEDARWCLEYIRFAKEVANRRDEFGFDEYDEDRLADLGDELNEIGSRIFSE